MSEGWGSGTKPASFLVAGSDLVKTGRGYEKVIAVEPVAHRPGWVKVTLPTRNVFHPDLWPVQWMGVVEADEARV